MESLIGKTIDGYRILEVIGRGGMGVVLKALDTSLEKIVALKMIDPFLARDENFVRRFKTEAKALARLENINIVSVYALRETEAGFFMVMELVAGKPLSHFLQENGPFNPNPFSLNDTLSITKQLLNAIGHAHSVGVIHRDIKPSNILLCDNGKIKVTDFGLAKVIQQKGPASTVTQTRAGTLYYMSPEQIKGLKNVDTRSDIYSLGMTVYEIIVGRVPFEKTESDYTIQKKIVEGEIPSPIKINVNIPKKLAKIISKSIDKDPDKRYQNAKEMLDDIEKFEKELIEEKKGTKSPPKIKPKPEIKPEVKKYKNLKLIPDIKFLKNPILIISSLAVLAILAVVYFIFTDPGITRLSVRTIPSEAMVLINDVDAGISPLEEYEIEKEGNVKIKITKAGFIKIDTSINLALGQTENLSFNLLKVLDEKITIKTIPVDAKIYIDGNPVGNTPLENYLLSQGGHQIKITKVGFKDVDTILTVNQNLEKIVNIKLTNDPAFKGFGSLTVTSIPSNASVLINGEVVGETKYENKELTIGEYQLVIRKEGYEDHIESIAITKQKPKIVNKTLKEINKSVRTVGKLEVKTNPEGADIYLNGERKDKSNFKKEDVLVGKYTLEIKKIGFLDVKETIVISSEKPTIISRNLVAAGNLSIESDPTGSAIYINNKSYGKTPIKNLQLPFAEYSVTIKRNGYRDKSENIIVNDNKTPYKINPELEPILGKLEILVKPYGDIYIDGKLEKKEAMTRFSIPLTGGNHTIRIVHPTLKGFDNKVITIVDEKPQSFIFDLTRVVKLTITSTPSNCEIFIDGNQYPNNTPTKINLKPGNYKIKVKKEGKELEKPYNVGVDIYENLKDLEDNLDFPLDKIQ